MAGAALPGRSFHPGKAYGSTYSAVGNTTWLNMFKRLPSVSRVFGITLRVFTLAGLAQRIRAKVRIFSGMMDNNCPPSSQSAVCNQIAGSKGSTLHPACRRGRLPGWEAETLQRLLAEL